jgi:hypothetical protein
MLEPENASESSLESLTGESSALQTLRDEIRALRSLFITASMGLLVLSFGINAHLYYQDRVQRRELNAAKRMVQEFEMAKRPIVSAFVAKLQEFSRSHPDFNPILDKYGIRPAASTPAPAPLPAKNGK